MCREKMKTHTTKAEQISRLEVERLRRYSEGRLVLVYDLHGNLKEAKAVERPTAIIEVIKA